MPSAMTLPEIEQALKPLPGWVSKDGCIIKEYGFSNYMDGIRFVEALAIEAEALDHHPDILVKYARVTVFLATHSVNGLTFKDFDLAARSEKAYEPFRPS